MSCCRPAGRPCSVKLRRIFERQVVAPWSYAIFYVDDLEIHPGPNLTVNGWVHSNGSVYTGHSSLTFASRMTYGERLEHRLHAGRRRTAARPRRAPAGRAISRPRASRASNRTGSIPRWSSAPRTPIPTTTPTGRSSSSGTQVTPIRSPTLTDPNNPQKARYYDQADFKIIVGNSGALTIKDSADNVLTSSSTGVSKQIYNLVNSAVTTGQTIQDNREAATVTVTTLDISKIYNAYKPGGSMANTGFRGSDLPDRLTRRPRRATSGARFAC